MTTNFNFLPRLYELTVAYKNGSFIDVPLDVVAAHQLACCLFEQMPKIAPEFADEFEGSLVARDFQLYGCPAQYFPAVANAIIEACDTIDSLTPYKDALNKALRADPRFQEKQAA